MEFFKFILITIILFLIAIFILKAKNIFYEYKSDKEMNDNLRKKFKKFYK